MQVINLTGIVDDGSIAGAILEGPQNITFPVGTNVTINVAVTNAAGTPITLTGVGTVGTITFQKDPAALASDIRVVGTVNPLTPTVMSFVLTPTDSAVPGPGTYSYDVGLLYGGAEYQIVVLSPAFIRSSLLRSSQPAPLQVSSSIIGDIGIPNSIVLTGRGLFTAISVTVDGVEATFTAASDARLDVISPTTLAVGTYDIVVTGLSWTQTVEDAWSVVNRVFSPSFDFSFS
jgi:hypothetical protein